MRSNTTVTKKEGWGGGGVRRGGGGVGLTIRNAEYLLYTLLLTTKLIYCQ